DAAHQHRHHASRWAAVALEHPAMVARCRRHPGGRRTRELRPRRMSECGDDVEVQEEDLDTAYRLRCPIAYNALSVRMKICPSATAGELSVYSSRSFSAMISNFGPARTTLVRPSSFVT